MALFKQATIEDSRLCMAIVGGPGTGKTYTSLKIASHMGERICLIDAEHGRASLYAREFQFDTAVLPNFHPSTYIHYLKAAEAEEYDVIILDGITPEWDGVQGCLSLVDENQRRGADKLRAWGQVTPLHDQFVQSILQCSQHLICTMRGRERYSLEKAADGKNQVIKHSFGAIQRENMAFEFAIIGAMDTQHNMQIVKTNCHALKGSFFHEPGEDLARILLEWLDEGKAGGPPRPRLLNDADIRSEIGAALRTGRWIAPQVTALMRSYDADSIESLSSDDRRKLVNTLQSTSGSEWVTYNRSGEAK